MAFQFKQFSVEDNKSTMKVGTDAVLLGAWTETKHSKTILEIGTGSGIISLMIAQRSKAKIEAIDIDEDTVKQANENFQKAEWKERLNAFHYSLNDFKKEQSNKYDLIISNPPFFIDSLKSPNKNKTLSKHSDELSYADLIQGLIHFLSPSGKACIILPYTESKSFINLARIENLYLTKQLLIKPKKDKVANRILMEFSFTKTQVLENEIYLREVDNSFSDEYKKLSKEYYLNL